MASEIKILKSTALIKDRDNSLTLWWPAAPLNVSNLVQNAYSDFIKSTAMYIQQMF